MSGMAIRETLGSLAVFVWLVFTGIEIQYTARRVVPSAP